jgi:hypothetical protein
MVKEAFLIEYVEWEDHWGLMEKPWYSPDDLPEFKPKTIQEVGFVVHEDEKGIFMVSQIDISGDAYGNGTYILKANITRRTKL